MDPVKIASLAEFGTPKQVAKRVLDAEVCECECACIYVYIHIFSGGWDA